MPLFGKSFTRRPSPRPGQVQRPVLNKPIVKPKPAAPSKPAGLFDKGSLKPWQLKHHFKKASSSIRGFGGRLSEKQRTAYGELLKKYGAGKSGQYAQKGYKLALDKMKKERMYTRDNRKREQLKRDIRYLEDQLKGLK